MDILDYLRDLGRGRSNYRTIKPSNHQTAKPSNRQTVKQSNRQTAKQSNSQTVKPSNSQTVKPSNRQTVKQSNSQTVKPSNQPAAGFTLLEILCAVTLVGLVTTLSVSTYYAISRSWEASTEYMDKMQRTDFALNQLISGLRSMYYPHDGKQDYNYGFVLIDNGNGEDPDRSDIIEWSKTGTAIVGNKSAVADSVHRVQVMVLEEGNHDWKEDIAVTGLYARHCPDPALRPSDDDIDYTFENDEMYQPVLIADGIVGFNCRVLKTADAATSDIGEPEFEDEWESSNSVPYKVELTFHVRDPEEASYRSNTAPLMRIVRIPVFEQSQDGSAPPGDDAGAAAADRDRGGRNRGGRGAGGAGGAGGGGAGGASGGGPGGGGAPPPPPGGGGR